MNTIVTAAFDCKTRAVRTAPVFRFDRGAVLTISGLELPAAYQVQFANGPTEMTKPMTVYDTDSVEIPEEYTQTGEPIYAYIYFVGDNYGVTKRVAIIPVNIRGEISADQPDAQQASWIDAAIAALNQAVEDTQQSAADAETAKTAAQGYAEQATTAATAAEAAQAAAQQSALDAQQAQSSAASERQQAETAANNAQSAQSAAETAQASAQLNAQAASQSADSANTAKTAAETARSGAETAKADAESAAADAAHERESAMLAAGAAGSAMLNAQTAQTAAETSATAAQQSATAAAQSATGANAAKTDAESSKTAAAASAAAAQAVKDSIPADYTSLNNDVIELKSAVTNKMVKIESHNIFDPDNIKESYGYNTYGIGADSTKLNCTNEIIPVTPGDVLRFYYQYNGATLSAAHTWTAYDNAGVASYTKSETNSSTYTVPDGIYGVRVSYYKNSNLTPMITVNYEATDFEEYFAPYYIGTNEFMPDLTATAENIRSSLTESIDDIETDVAEITDKMTRTTKSYNEIVVDNLKFGYLCSKYGVISANVSYNCTIEPIAVNPGDTIRFYSGNELSAARIFTAYLQDKTPFGNAAGENESTYIVPDNIYWINVTYYASVKFPMLTINHEATAYVKGEDAHFTATDEFLPEINGTNVLNTSELLAEHNLTASGGVVENTAYATTGFIPVESSDSLVATFDRGLAITLARVVAYDDNKNVVPSAGAANITEYPVPAGIKYVRFCANNTYLTDPKARVSLNGVHEHYSPYIHGRVDRIIAQNDLEISNILRYPFTTMRQDILHNLAYKPIGPLSKGYVCIVSDDGDEAVATYTIPMFISKSVPCTLAMMKDSRVFGTTEGLNTVLDAVNNHGFCVAQHGGLYWTTYYDEYTLSQFFDSEKVYWDSIGITPYGACAPGHQVNDMIRAMCGGRFGCHRVGYFDGAPWYGDTRYINGPRSNMYSLTSQNIIESNLDYWKEKCDMTLANKWLMMIHLHEVELTADGKTQLEAVIDYAKQIGLTFITMKEIPTII